MIVNRIILAVRTAPRARDLAELGLAIGILTLAAGAISYASGLAHWSPRPTSEVLLLAARAFFLPALGEELVFRGALTPSRAETKRPFRPIALSTVLFTAWHVVETLFLPSSATTFLRIDFLFLAALLGLTCAILRYRSGSLWTAVVLHWLLVIAWQGWFGGPSFGS